MTAGTRGARRFAIGLGAIAGIGLALRLSYVLAQRRDVAFGGDAFFYHASANLLAEGKAFISPWLEVHGYEVPAAEHPPLYSVFLAVPSVLGMQSVLTHILWSCLLGTATIVVVGLLARDLADRRVGLIAALLAALYPSVWAPDGALQAETLAMFLTALLLLLAYRYLRRPSLSLVIAVGVTAGAAALTRSELVLFVPLLVAPLPFLARAGELRARMKAASVAVLAATVLMAPWIGYNLARFEHPVFLSTQFEALLASANCDLTYYGDLIGYFAIPCVEQLGRREDLGDAPEIDQSQQSLVFGREAREYVVGHLHRLPAVVAARLGRILGVYKPGQQLSIDRLFDGREVPVSRGAFFGFWVLAPLAVLGAAALRRRRVRLYPMLVVVGVVLVTVVVTYANLRFRTPAEIVVVVLGAIGIDSLATTAVQWRRARDPGKSPVDVRADGAR